MAVIPMGEAVVNVKADTVSFTQNINNAEKHFSNFGASVKSIALSAGAAIAAIGAGAAMKSFLDTAKSFETMAVSLETITGSSKGAEDAMAWITEFTKKTPYELDQVTEGFIKLQNYGLDATENLQMLGDTAGAMGKSLNQAVEMFADAITGENERLKEFGVKAKKSGDKITYHWAEAGKNMTLTAENNAESISQALTTIFSRFQGGMDAQSQTWEGMMSNLADHWTLFKKSVMDAGLFDAMRNQLAGLLDKVNEWAESGVLDEWAKQLSDGVMAVATSIADTVTDLGSYWSAIKSGFEAIAPYYENLKSNIADLFSWIDENSDTFSKFWESLEIIAGLAISNLSEALSGFGDDAAAAIGDELLENLNLFSGWVDQNQANIAGFFGALGETWKAVGEGVGTVMGIVADAYDYIEVATIEWIDMLGRGWISIEYAAEKVWAGIQDYAAIALSSIIDEFAEFVEVAAKGANALGLFEHGGEAQRFAMQIRMVSKETKEWASHIQNVEDRQKDALKIHDQAIDALKKNADGYKDNSKEAEILRDKIQDLQKSADEDIDVNAYYWGHASSRKPLLEKTREVSDAMMAFFDVASRDVEAQIDFSSGGIGLSDQLENLTDETRANLTAQTDYWMGMYRDSKDSADEYYRFAALQLELQKTESIKTLQNIKGAHGISAEEREEIEKAYDERVRQLMEDRVADNRQKAEEINTIYQDLYDAVGTLSQDSFDNKKRLLDLEKEETIQQLKDLKDNHQLTAEERALIDSAYDEKYKALLQEQQQIALEFYEKSGTNADLLYQQKMDLIDQEAEKYRAAGVDAVDVAQWQADEYRKLELEKLQASDDFFAGIKAGLIESQTNMMTWADAGRSIYQSFVDETSQSFSQLINGVLQGDMESLRGAWDSLWQGMLAKVIDTVAQMAAKWAAAKVTEGAMAIADELILHEGAFDVGRSGPGTPNADGEYPAILQAGETVLPADLTDRLKQATGFDEFAAEIKKYFGLDDDQASSFFSNVGDYAGAGKSLFGAYQAFESGEWDKGSVQLMEGMGQAFSTYGEQYGSELASNIGTGLTGAAGAFGAGIGAYTSFDQGNYVQGAVQSVQAVQAAAETVAAIAGAESAIGQGAGKLAESLGGTVTNIGYATALWSAIALMSGDEHMQSKGASVGAAVGATVGSYVPVVGTYAGAVIGGAIGTIYDIEAHPNERFDLNDLDPYLNNNRRFENGQLTYIPDLNHPDAGNEYVPIFDSYVAAINSQTDAVNQFSAQLKADLPPQYHDAFDRALASNLPDISSGGNWERYRAENVVGGVANYHWGQTVDALIAGVNSVSEAFEQDEYFALTRSLDSARPPRSYVLDPARPPTSMDNTFIRPNESYASFKNRHPTTPITQDEFDDYLAQKKNTIHAGEGHASGGIVDELLVPPGGVAGADDGWALLRASEGILTPEGVNALGELNDGIFGNTDNNIVHAVEATTAELQRQNRTLTQQNKILSAILAKTGFDLDHMTTRISKIQSDRLSMGERL